MRGRCCLARRRDSATLDKFLMDWIVAHALSEPHNCFEGWMEGGKVLRSVEATGAKKNKIRSEPKTNYVAMKD